jgi:adenylate cyclase
MDAPEAGRKLAAIVAADVVGYSRLMQEDDRGTLAALTERRKLFAERVTRHRGRIVNAPGDSILAEFSSIVDAVEAAIEIQRVCASDGKPMQFRIGVNLGDVLVDAAGAIYGDGVNIAARLESLAPSGGICVSKSVHDQVKGRLRLDFEDLGERAVKNIAAPMHVFCLAASGATAPAVQPAAPRANSIAILAFDNMTGEPARELFCDGISEDIMTDLSKTNGIAVIGRQSSFTYKGKPRDLRVVARELGVKYVLEGSVRKAGNTIRVTAQLIEADTGTHVWANRYDRTLDDVFLVGDEITEDIVTSLDVKLSHGEEARIWRKAMRLPQARDLFNIAMNTRDRGTPQDVQRSRELFLEAARLEPDSPWPRAHAAVTHVMDVMHGWSGDRPRSLEEARKLALKSLELEDSVAGAYVALGVIALFEDRHDEALAHLERSREMRPMCFGPRAYLSYGQLYSGLWESAAESAAQAVELNPMYPMWYRYLIGAARYFAQKLDEAVPVLRGVKSADPRLIPARLAIIGAEMARGHREDAAAEAATVLGEQPDFTLAKFAATQPFRDKELRGRYLESLREAGLPG